MATFCRVLQIMTDDLESVVVAIGYVIRHLSGEKLVTEVAGWSSILRYHDQG